MVDQDLEMVTYAVAIGTIQGGSAGRRGAFVDTAATPYNGSPLMEPGPVFCPCPPRSVPGRCRPEV
jgi:hypothetical protein